MGVLGAVAAKLRALRSEHAPAKRPIMRIRPGFGRKGQHHHGPSVIGPRPARAGPAMTTVARPAGAVTASHQLRAGPLARPARQAVRPATMPGKLRSVLAGLGGGPPG